MASYDGLVSTFLLAIFVIQVIKFGHSNASTNVSCIGAEREALMKFKHGLTDPWRRLSSWTSEECCKWEGVKCNKKTGHVLKLDLHNPCIEDIGMIAPLDKSRLGGNIVPSLTKLMIAPLDKCRLGGNIVPSLTKLKYLKYLDLSFNNFSTQKIPMFFASLQKLEYLNLSYAGFYGHIPRQLNNLSKLQYLDLSSPYITSNDLDWVSKLFSLKFLHMSYVGLSKAEDWFYSINMLPSLQSLRLRNCELQHISSSSQANFTSLRFLDIRSNSISSIPPWIYNLSQLEHIDLASNLLFKSHFSMAIFENNRRLAYFDVSRNFLQGEFPKNLSSLCKLQVVRLHVNHFNGTIPESIGRLSNLKELHLAQNLLYGVVGELHFENLKSLTTLDISSNKLILNVSFAWVPPFQARDIDLSDCKVGPEFPRWLQTQRNITSLSMSNAGISGDITDWLYNISSNIESLDISSNMLRGQVPRDIGDKMPRLRVLRLWDNSLTGDIPSSLCKLNRLARINLSNNQLSGRLSPCWGALQDLSVFAFGDNQLNGQIPKSFCHLQLLSMLSLKRNGFTGDIPICLSNLSFSFIDLSDNEFTGRLPPFGKHSPYLAVINLEKNRFVGGIPPQFCQLRGLRFLSLAHNNISGPIPNCIDGFLSMVDSVSVVGFGEMNSLNFVVNTKGTSQIYGDVLSFYFSIDLSANMLDGHIPEEFTRLVALQNLDLSQNNLSGYIPSNISDLKHLESLDLSKNKLSGTIPSGISSMDFLSHLNLSFNRLSGPIPSGNHLRTVDDESTYRGNNELCGAPLPKICLGDEPPSSDGQHGDNSSEDKPSEPDLDIHDWFYAGLGPGFIVGFMGFCSILHFKRSWRVSYFRAMDRAIEIFSMTMMITILWFKRTFRQRE